MCKLFISVSDHIRHLATSVPTATVTSTTSSCPASPTTPCRSALVQTSARCSWTQTTGARLAPLTRPSITLTVIYVVNTKTCDCCRKAGSFLLLFKFTPISSRHANPVSIVISFLKAQHCKVDLKKRCSTLDPAWIKNLKGQNSGEVKAAKNFKFW